MHNGLTVAAWQLTDSNPGDGGLCLIPGSHKGNYACPQEVRKWLGAPGDRAPGRVQGG